MCRSHTPVPVRKITLISLCKAKLLPCLAHGGIIHGRRKKEEEEEEEKEKEIDEKCTMTNFHERKEELIIDFLPLPSSRCFEEVKEDDDDDDITWT